MAWYQAYVLWENVGPNELAIGNPTNSIRTARRHISIFKKKGDLPFSRSAIAFEARQIWLTKGRPRWWRPPLIAREKK